MIFLTLNGHKRIVSAMEPNETFTPPLLHDFYYHLENGVPVLDTPDSI